MKIRTILRRSATTLVATSLISGAMASALPSIASAAKAPRGASTTTKAPTTKAPTTTAPTTTAPITTAPTTTAPATLAPATAAPAALAPAAPAPAVDPTAALAASPNTGTSPLPVTLATSGSVAGTADTWTLDYGDATPVLAGTGSIPASVSHTYAAAGAFTATLTVTAPGSPPVISTFPVAINVTAPPTVAALSATGASGAAPLAVTFDGSASTSVGTWTLDYGDGSPVLSGSGPIAATGLGAHTYQAGAYTARLTVVNGSVTSVAATSVKATAPATDGTGTYDPATKTRSFDLYARANGSVTVAGRTDPIPTWGFSLTPAGPPTLSGPRLVATSGETLKVTLHNDLNATLPTGLVCPATCDAGPIGLDLPAVAGIPQPAAAEGGTVTETFHLTAPGTYVYEAGNDPQFNRQIAMGLAGVLIVRSGLGTTTAYGTGGLYDTFSKEEVVAVNDIDPEFNDNPFTHDLDHTNPSYFFIDGAAYDPLKPNADPATAGFDPSVSNPELDVSTGDKVLVRYANLGLHDHSMGLVNLRQTEVARDSSLLVNPVDQRTEWLTSGEVADTFVQIPPSAPTGSSFPLYDAGFHTFNGGAPGLGGMYTTFKVTSGAAGSPSGPAVTCLGDSTCVTPIQVDPVDAVDAATNSGTDLTVTVHLAAQPGHTVTAARWFLDQPDGTAAAHLITPTSETAGPTPNIVTMTFSVPWSVLEPLLATGGTIPFGDHIIWVEGQDDSGIWGQAAGDVVTIGTTAPLVTAVSLSPGTTNAVDTPSVVDGTPAGQVAVTATAAASLPGYSVDKAEACVVPKTGVTPVASDWAACLAPGQNQALTIGTGGDPTSIGGSVTVPTAAGSYWVLVSAEATDGTHSGWSPWVSVDPVTNVAIPDTYQTVQVVTPAQAPTVGGLAVKPNPNNGLQDGPGNLGLFAAVEVTGTATSAAGAPIALAEAFLGTSYPKGTAAPATPTYPNGSGFEMIPANAHWGDSPTKGVAAYIPLADIAAQPDGLVPIYVHAKDTAGNWGPLTEVDLTLDAHPPVVSTVVAGAAHSALVTASDPVVNGVSSGVVAAEWFTGADPGTGNGHPFTAIPAASAPGASVTFTVPTGLTAGTIISVRVIDAAGNWSPVKSAAV